MTTQIVQHVLIVIAHTFPQMGKSNSVYVPKPIDTYVNTKVNNVCIGQYANEFHFNENINFYRSISLIGLI